jgi:hypothetical protein
MAALDLPMVPIRCNEGTPGKNVQYCMVDILWRRRVIQFRKQEWCKLIQGFFIGPRLLRTLGVETAQSVQLEAEQQDFLELETLHQPLSRVPTIVFTDVSFERINAGIHSDVLAFVHMSTIRTTFIDHKDVPEECPTPGEIDAVGILPCLFQELRPFWQLHDQVQNLQREAIETGWHQMCKRQR